MPLTRTGFYPEFVDLLAGAPEFGSAALLPWDTEIFRFPVASFRTGRFPIKAESQNEFRELFLSWMDRNGVALCSCAVEASDMFWKQQLPQLGFLFVDCGVEASLNELDRAVLPKARTTLRRARPEDWSQIEQIASGSFRHGRYHADPLFPKALASLRYQTWIRKALSINEGIDRVYVMDFSDQVQGFYHVAVENDFADLRLAATAPKFRGTLVGFDLYTAMLHALRDLGVRRVVTNISAANSAVMNIYAAHGFRFTNPEFLYHLHTTRFDRSLAI